MKKNYLILIALVIGMMVGTTSCKKKSVTPTQPTEDQPTEDQLKVKTMVEAIVYGEQGASYYATALQNRLLNRVSTFNDSTTKVIVVYNSFVPQLTSEHYRNIYYCFKNGGSVLICAPTAENYASIFREGVIEAAYNEDVLKYNTEGITREQWMKYVGNRLFAINGVEQTTEGAMAGCVGFHNGKKYVLARISDDVDVTSITNYQYGLMADGAAQWINDTYADEKIGFKSMFGKDNELSDLSDAEILTVESAVSIEDWDNVIRRYNGVVQNILTVYAASSQQNKYDYYQIDQNITFRNAGINPAPDINNHTSWWQEGGYSFVKSQAAFTTKMYLSIPEGTTHIYSSHPETANNSYSSSYETSEGEATSVTNGGSIGFSLGFSGADISGDFSAAYEHSVTNEESFSTTTGKSCTINDLSVTKSTVNEDGFDKVKWDYVFKTPYQYWVTGSSKGSGDSEPEPTQVSAWWAAPLAMTDCSQQNTMLYYVENPSGEATVHCHNSWRYYCSYDKGSGVISNECFVTDHSTTDFVLRCPMRYFERWGISCVDYGDIVGNSQLIALFEQRITNDIIGGANNKFNNIGGVDENDNTDANRLLNLFINDFAIMADSYAQSGFTGTYKFRLEATDTHRKIEKTYTIE